MLLSFRIVEGMFLNFMFFSYSQAISYLREKKDRSMKARLARMLPYLKIEVLCTRQNVLCVLGDWHVQVMPLLISNIFC